MIFDVYTALRHMAADGKTITLTDNESIRYSHSKYYNRIGWIENRADGMVNEGSIGIDYWVKENEQRMFELYQEPEEPGPVYAVGDPYTDIREGSRRTKRLPRMGSNTWVLLSTVHASQVRQKVERTPQTGS